MPIASPPQDYQLERPGCSGIACGPEVSIRDPSSLENEMPRGRTGAVAIRGFPAFSGYEVSSDRSVPLDKSCFSASGWFDTGDMGNMDHDGYVLFLDQSSIPINNRYQLLVHNGKVEGDHKQGWRSDIPIRNRRGYRNGCEGSCQGSLITADLPKVADEEGRMSWPSWSSMTSYKKQSALSSFLSLESRELGFTSFMIAFGERFVLEARVVPTLFLATTFTHQNGPRSLFI